MSRLIDAWKCHDCGDVWKRYDDTPPPHPTWWAEAAFLGDGVICDPCHTRRERERAEGKRPTVWQSDHIGRPPEHAWVSFPWQDRINPARPK